MRRAELIQHLQAQNYTAREIESLLRGLHRSSVLKCTVGRYADVFVA